MGKMLGAYLRLFRIEHALMLAVAVLLGELLSGALPQFPFLLLSLCVPVFIEMGSFALNDYFDVKTDKENRRKDRPIASGEIKGGHALAAAAFCYVIGIASALPLPSLAPHIAIAFAFLSILYNYRLKDLPLLGNIYIAASMAIPFIFGNIVVSQQILPPILAIALVAFIAGLGREIIKSAEDVEGDTRHRNARTLPAVIGVENSSYIAAALYLLLVPISFLPFSYGMRTNMLSLGLVAITALAFLFMAVSVARDQDKENLISLRKASLLALGIGLLGYAASLI